MVKRVLANEISAMYLRRHRFMIWALEHQCTRENSTCPLRVIILCILTGRKLSRRENIKNIRFKNGLFMSYLERKSISILIFCIKRIKKSALFINNHQNMSPYQTSALIAFQFVWISTRRGYRKRDLYKKEICTTFHRRVILKKTIFNKEVGAWSQSRIVTRKQ